MNKLSWQESFGGDVDEENRNSALMEALQQANIPFTITKEPGQREDEEYVLRIGDGTPGTLYAAAGYNGYFLDVLKVDRLVRGADLEEIVRKIRFLQGFKQ